MLRSLVITCLAGAGLLSVWSMPEPGAPQCPPPQCLPQCPPGCGPLFVPQVDPPPPGGDDPCDCAGCACVRGLYLAETDAAGVITLTPHTCPTEPDPEPDPPPAPFVGFVDDFEGDELNPAWLLLAGTAEVNAGDLALTATSTTAAVVELQREWQQPIELRLEFAKNSRPLDVLLPGGYFARLGGRYDGPNKYSTHVSLFAQPPAGELELVDAVGYVPNEEQTAIVQLLPDQVRIYLRRESNGTWLHNDGAWRPQLGPCIAYDMQTVIAGKPGLRGNHAGNMHLLHYFEVSQPIDRGPESYYPNAGPVPPLSADGLQLPEIPHTLTHAGLAFRGDGNNPVDDPTLLDLVSFAPFGPPPGVDGLGYIAATVWTDDSWNAWLSYCQAHGVTPATGRIGELAGQPGGVPYGFGGGAEIGIVNLANTHVRAHLKLRAQSLAAAHYVGIFFDVTNRFDTGAIGFDLPFTATEWADLQGSLYREIWRDVLKPVGKWPMVNGGHAKTDRNRRLLEWVPVCYMDRQINGAGLVADWSWLEQTVIANAAYRQGVFGNQWISVLDGLGGDAICLNEDRKYGWLTTYYLHLATLGGFHGRHYLAGGFNGDWQADGHSGRSKWRARHFVPAMEYVIGQPTSQVEVIGSGVKVFAGQAWTFRLYAADFEGGQVLHFPNYLQQDGFAAPSLGIAPPQLVQFSEPQDVLQFDGSWLPNQLQVEIPAGSGRIVRPSIN